MKKLNISQSLIKDVLVINSADPKEVIKPQHCPRYLKYKYVDHLKGKDTEAMLYGRFFEWHLLGATRGGEEPIIPKVGIRDLRPKKSARKDVMWNYITEKTPFAKIEGTGERVSNKPKLSAAKAVLEDYIKSKGFGDYIPEKASKEILYNIIDLDMPEDLGKPEVTQEDLYNYIQTLPIDLSEGEQSAQEVRLMALVEVAKGILKHMGLDVRKGRKQVFIKKGRKSGNLDWIVKGIRNIVEKSIIDVKWTKTKKDDWRNGWGDPETKEDAKIQAAHYIKLYFEKYGVLIPFYFIVFGDEGWIKVLRYRITDSSLAEHEELELNVQEMVDDFQKKGFPARPEFNRCLDCPFAEVCTERSLLPEIEEIIW